MITFLVIEGRLLLLLCVLHLLVDDSIFMVILYGMFRSFLIREVGCIHRILLHAINILLGWVFILLLILLLVFLCVVLLLPVVTLGLHDQGLYLRLWLHLVVR